MKQSPISLLHMTSAALEDMCSIAKRSLAEFRATLQPPPTGLPTTPIEIDLLQAIAFIQQANQDGVTVISDQNSPDEWDEAFKATLANAAWALVWREIFKFYPSATYIVVYEANTGPCLGVPETRPGEDEPGCVLWLDESDEPDTQPADQDKVLVH